MDTTYKDHGKIECLVWIYQLHGPESKDAAEQLINQFAPLLKKYIHLLFRRSIDWENEQTIAFISLFFRNRSIREKIKNNSLNFSEKQKIIDILRLAFKTLTRDQCRDTASDLYCILLTLAKRYQQKDRSFVAYMNRTFPYEVYRYIRKRTKDPLTYDPWPMEDEIIINSKCGKLLESYQYSIELYLDNLYSSEGIPTSEWISGMCSPIFKSLSIKQRQMLVQYYLQKYNDRQISIHMGHHINTVNTDRRKAVKDLERSLDLKSSRKRQSGRNIDFYLTETDDCE